jgi:GTP cyclohydrolase I
LIRVNAARTSAAADPTPMNQPAETQEFTSTIPDVQARADTRRIPIDKVGIKDILHPVRIQDRTGDEQHTVARFNMYVNLPHNFKGTHMSRFVEILNKREREITVRSFREMLAEMTEKLEAEAGHIEMTFPYFVLKRAPVSGVESLMDYEVTLIGEIVDGETRTYIKVIVPVTSLCPCSKKISDRGAHNQRSHVTLTVRLRDFVWIEEVIDIVEAEASCQLYGLLKRPDEKFVTEYAYDNPKFVEDMVRDIAVRLNADERIGYYMVESENFESIHNHSAYALIERDKDADEAKAAEPD